MNRKLRVVLIAAGALLVLALILPLFVNVNAFRPKLEAELSDALGRQVKVGELSLSIFAGSVSADNISIADDPAFSDQPFLTAKAFKAGVHLKPLIFSKTLHVTEVTLQEPQITLLRGANGKWNMSSLGASSKPKTPQAETGTSPGALSVDKINIEKGRMLVGTANSSTKPKVYENVNLEVTGFSPSSQFPFALTADLPGGGDLSLKGKCGPMKTGDTGSMPFDAALNVRKLNLAQSGFTDPSSGIEGLANFEAQLRSDGRQANSTGTIELDNWKLAAEGSPSKQPLSLRYAVAHNLVADSGSLSQGEIRIGKAVANLTGTYQKQGAATGLNMRLNAPGMPVDELEAALPAVGVMLPSGSKLQGGTLSADLGISGATGGLVIAGPVRLSNAKLAGFDLGPKLAVLPALTGKQLGGNDTTIQEFSANIRQAPDGTQVNTINGNIPAIGVLTGNGTVSPAGALNFKMSVALSGGAGGGVIQRAGIGGSGGGVPFGIQGTTSNPKFVPDVAGMAGNVLQQAISSKTGGADSGIGGLTKGILGRKKK